MNIPLIRRFVYSFFVLGILVTLVASMPFLVGLIGAAAGGSIASPIPEDALRQFLTALVVVVAVVTSFGLILALIFGKTVYPDQPYLEIPVTITVLLLSVVVSAVIHSSLSIDAVQIDTTQLLLTSGITIILAIVTARVALRPGLPVVLAPSKFRRNVVYALALLLPLGIFLVPDAVAMLPTTGHLATGNYRFQISYPSIHRTKVIFEGLDGNPGIQGEIRPDFNVSYTDGGTFPVISGIVALKADGTPVRTPPNSLGNEPVKAGDVINLYDPMLTTLYYGYLYAKEHADSTSTATYNGLDWTTYVESSTGGSGLTWQPCGAAGGSARFHVHQEPGVLVLVSESACDLGTYRAMVSDGLADTVLKSIRKD